MKQNTTSKKIKKAITSFRGRAILAAMALVSVGGFASSSMYLAHAASVSNSYSPASQSLANGSNVTLTINTNAGSNHVLTDQLRVTYDPAKLKYISVSYSGSPLDQSAPEEASGTGYYQIARYTLGTKPTGSFKLATITFQALTSSGSATVGYDAANSSVYVQEDGGAANALTGTSGSTITLTAPADTTKPSVTITAPNNGQTVSGSSLAFSANAADNVGVTKVEFYLGTTLKNTDTSSPYSTTIDTKSVSDGSQNLTAKAYDAAGNNAIAVVSVTVKNSTGTTASTSTPKATSTATPSSSSTSSPSSTSKSTPSSTPSSSSSSSNTTGGESTVSTPYVVDSLPDTDAKSKKVSGTVAAGLSIAGIAVIAAGAFFGMRLMQSRRQAAAFGDHAVNIPEGATLYKPEEHPSTPMPTNVPGAEIRPDDSAQDKDA